MTMSVIDRDLGWKRIIGDLTAVDGKSVDVGLLSSAGAEDGVSLAKIAGWQEFGVDKITVTPKMRGWFHHQGGHISEKTKYLSIPARPFMATTFAEKKGEIFEFIAKQKDAVIDGKFSFSTALGNIGAKYVGMIQKTISKGGFTPNAAFTVARKGKGKKPLVDEGTMRKAVNWELTK